MAPPKTKYVASKQLSIGGVTIPAGTPMLEIAELSAAPLPRALAGIRNGSLVSAAAYQAALKSAKG